MSERHGKDKKRFSWLLAPFSFLTIIPTGFYTVQEVANGFLVFPVVGVFTGAVMGFVDLLSRNVPPAYISSTLALLSLVILTGANEIDGLIDFCDSLMVVGNPERRLQAMKTSWFGVGGFTGGFFSLTLLIFGVAHVPPENTLGTCIASEIFGKLSMIYLGIFSKPATQGTGAQFINAARKKKWLSVFATAITLITFPFIGWLWVPVLSITAVCTALISGISHKVLGGVNGDVFGALNMITDTTIVLFLGAIW